MTTAQLDRTISDRVIRSAFRVEVVPGWVTGLKSIRWSVKMFTMLDRRYPRGVQAHYASAETFIFHEHFNIDQIESVATRI